jgi:hypothetical protein
MVRQGIGSRRKLPSANAGILLAKYEGHITSFLVRGFVWVFKAFFGGSGCSCGWQPPGM